MSFPQNEDSIVYMAGHLSSLNSDIRAVDSFDF